MPTPLQAREQNLTKLYEAFKGKNVTNVDAIYNKTLEFFPNITQTRAKDYARTVLRMLKTKKKES